MTTNNKNKKAPSKIAQWWQRVRQKAQQARTYTHDQYEELHRKQKYYDADASEEQETTRQPERITMLTAVRIMLAELGEKEYWRTLWYLIWRPGYVIADFLNGKRRRFLRPFQLLIGTSLLLAIALYIVPAEKKPLVSLETSLSQQLADENYTRDLSPEETEAYNNAVHKVAHALDTYYEWLDEHLAMGLLIKSILFIFLTWLLFRKSPREGCPFIADDTGGNKVNYNFAEILTALIFIIAQLQMINVVWVLVAGWFVPSFEFHPYAYPGFLINIIAFIDFQQLFGRKWYSTLWRTLLCVIW